jgi:hypothetical protein
VWSEPTIPVLQRAKTFHASDRAENLDSANIIGVTVAELFKAWNALARLDAGIVGSDPTRGMDVYVDMYVCFMFMLSCVGRGLAMSWSPVQGVLPAVLD